MNVQYETLLHWPSKIWGYKLNSGLPKLFFNYFSLIASVTVTGWNVFLIFICIHSIGLFSSRTVFLSFDFYERWSVLITGHSYIFSFNKFTVIIFNIKKQPPKVFCKKKVFLEISQNSQENTCAREKESLAQMFSCEFCEICNKFFFAKHL